MSWYYVDRKGKTHGPHSIPRLQKKYLTGIVFDGTYVWNGLDVKEWTPVRQIPNLLHSLQQARVDLPPPPPNERPSSARTAPLYRYDSGQESPVATQSAIYPSSAVTGPLVYDEASVSPYRSPPSNHYDPSLSAPRQQHVRDNSRKGSAHNIHQPYPKRNSSPYVQSTEDRNAIDQYRDYHQSSQKMMPEYSSDTEQRLRSPSRAQRQQVSQGTGGNTHSVPNINDFSSEEHRRLPTIQSNLIDESNDNVSHLIEIARTHDQKKVLDEQRTILQQQLKREYEEIVEMLQITFSRYQSELDKAYKRQSLRIIQAKQVIDVYHTQLEISKVSSSQEFDTLVLQLGEYANGSISQDDTDKGGNNSPNKNSNSDIAIIATNKIKQAVHKLQTISLQSQFDRIADKVQNIKEAIEN